MKISWNRCFMADYKRAIFNKLSEFREEANGEGIGPQLRGKKRKKQQQIGNGREERGCGGKIYFFNRNSIFFSCSFISFLI